MQAVILAGGLGTRLRPITLTVPKSMVKIKDRPFVEYLVVRLKEEGATSIHICTGYLANQIVEFLGNGERYGIDISYSREDSSLGTGGAVKNAERYLEQEFVILQGDTFASLDTGHIMDYFKSKNLSALMVASNLSEYANLFNVQIDIHDNRLLRYSKKRQNPQLLNCVDIGVYAFNKSTLFEHFPTEDIFSLEEIVFPTLISKQRFYGYVVPQRFYDIGSPQGLKALSSIM